MVKYFFLFISILYSTGVYSQAEPNYTSHKENLIEGIYKNFDEFKRNVPSIQEKAFTTPNDLANFYLDGITKIEKIFYYDSIGNSIKLNRKDIWGYCNNNEVFILSHNRFHRLGIIGRITHYAEMDVPNFGIINSMSAENHQKEKIRQFLLDYNTGRIYPYNLNNFLLLLKSDEELYADFISIKRKSKMKDKIFLYLKEFNKRNPI